ncbi:hypothetical protein LCGC14_1806780, partial [marine sediment metagenome]
GREDDRWIFIPAVDLIRRIAAEDKYSSFVGSDFSHEDVSGRNVAEDIHTLLGEEKLGDREVFVIESVPRQAAAYTKRVSWIDKKNFSYGMHKAYEDTEDGSDNKAVLTLELTGNFVIMTDRNVDGKVYWTSDNNYNKPANHRDDGFNCLTYQGSVKFHKTQVDTIESNSEAGISNDDVFLAGDEDGTQAGNANSSADPTDDTDTFIVPWED